MIRITLRAAGTALAAALLAAVTLTAAPAPIASKTEVVKDRDSFIPLRKYAPVGGKVIGLLVSDVAGKMSHDGRGGPPDAMGFSVDNGSYRWVYVPVAAPDAIIQNLQVPVGEKGDRVQKYPLLNMANARTIKQWNIQVPYALVEIEVNNEQGSPAGESFVGTKMTRLDGTKEYPLDVTATLADLKKRHAEWKKEQKDKLDEALAGAQKKAIKDHKPTGPQETQELMYMTWLSDSKKTRRRCEFASGPQSPMASTALSAGGLAATRSRCRCLRVSRCRLRDKVLLQPSRRLRLSSRASAPAPALASSSASLMK
jgi:hypothetical protein